MSLTKCLKTAGKAVDEQRVRDLREEYLKDGLDPKEAGKLAAADYLTELESERSALAMRVESEGGIIDSPAFSFAGPNARAPRGIAPLEIAQAYLDEGVDSDAVRKLTGWFVGDYDGKWRFEFSDRKAKLKLALESVPESPLFGGSQLDVMKLEDVLEHDELFSAYPEARDIEFIKRPGFLDMGGLQGWFDGKNQIGLTPYVKDPIGTLLHEVQHWIQSQEGFATGGNESSAIENLSPELLKVLAEDLSKDMEKSLLELDEARTALVKLVNDPATVAATMQYTLVLKRRTDGWSDEELKAYRDLRTERYRAAVVEASRVLGREGSFKWSKAEDKAFNTLILHDRPIAKLDEDVVEVQKALAGIRSGDLKALTKAAKATGAAYNLYRRIAGEIEARNVPTRKDMSDEDLMIFHPRDTVEEEIQRLDKKDVIVVFDNSGGNSVVEVEPELAEEVAASTQEVQFSRRTAAPNKTITAYKLFRQKNGQLYPLFIGKNDPTPVGEWIAAEFIPTKGFADRPGWHAGVLPMAPHLRTKDNQRADGRVWAEVEMPADVDWQSRADLTTSRDIRDAVPVGGHYRFKTSKMQGGAWLIGGALKVNRVLSDEEVARILTEAGHAEEVKAETRGVQFSRGPKWSSTLSKTFMDQGGTSRSGREWASWIQGNKSKYGVKSEEIEWSGLNEFLDVIGKEKVSGGAVGQWVADNGVQILETELTGNDTRYSPYTTPGGSDYTELLLRLEDPTVKEVTSYQVRGAFPAEFPTKEEAEAYVQRLQEGTRGVAGLEHLVELMEQLPFSVHAVTEEVLAPNATAFRSDHWSQKNILAHVRYDTREDTGGNKVLFIQEIQSDWAQEGRRIGFAKPAPEPVGKVTRRNGEWGVVDSEGNFWRAASRAEAEASAGVVRPSGTPSGPFVQETKSWVTLSLKRLIQAAVDAGSDVVAWTSGEQQSARYNLSEKVLEIRWLHGKEAGRGNLVVISIDENQILNEEMEESRVPSYIGEALSKKLFESKPIAGHSRMMRAIGGEGLRMGGEGMVEFYDRIVPRAANDLIKKYGSRVGPVEIEVPADEVHDGIRRYDGPPYTLDEVEEMEEDGETLEDLMNLAGGNRAKFNRYREALSYTAKLMRNSSFDFAVAIDIATYDAGEEGDQLVKYLGGKWLKPGPVKVTQLGFVITPELRAAAEQGMPLFSRQRRGRAPMPGQVRTGQMSPLPGTPTTNNVSGQIPHAPRFAAIKNAHEKLVDRINQTFSSPLSGMIQEADYRTIRGLTHGRVAIVDEVTADLNKQLSKMSESQNARALHYLKTKNAPVPNLGNAELERTVRSVKDTFASLGQQMVDRGMIPQESFDKLGEAYVPRIYLIHLFGDAKQRSELASGKLPDLSRTKARKDIPEELRQLMGEVDNVAFLASTGIGQEMRDVALIDWLDEVAKNKNWVLQEDLMEWDGRRMTPHALLSFAERLRSMADYQGTDPQRMAATLATADAMDTAARQHIAAHQRTTPDIAKTFIAIPDTARYGNLRGLRVRREIYNDIVAGRDAAAEIGLIEMTFAAGGPLASKGTALFKEMKVVQNPVSHVRNYVANGVLAHLAGIPFIMVPIRQAQALAAVLGTNPRWTKYYGIAKKYGLTSGTFASQELNQAKTEYRKYLLRHEKSGFKKIGHALAVASDTIRQPMRKLYQGEEAVWKVAALIHAMEWKKMPAGEAAAWANDALMDYSDVTTTVRALRNSPYGMPFATFQSKATARVLETAVTRPWSFAPYAVIAGALGQMLIDTLGDVDDDDFEALKKNMPKWAQERVSATILPFKDAYGRWVTIDFSAFLPWAQQLDALRLLGEGRTPEATKQLGLFTGPLSSIVVAWTTGEDVFTGRPIYNEWDEGRVKAGKMINYVLNMWIPPMLSTMENSIGNKLIDFAQGRPSPTGDETFTAGQMAARLAGVNVYPFIPFEERKKIVNREKMMISQIKAQRNKVMRNQSLSDEERDKEFERLTAQIEARREEIFKYREESEIPASME